jgi:hypothetical protein
MNFYIRNTDKSPAFFVFKREKFNFWSRFWMFHFRVEIALRDDTELIIIKKTLERADKYCIRACAYLR